MIALPGITTDRLITTNYDVTQLIQDAVVAIGVSGGKDSCAVALVIKDYLQEIGHSGECILIHSDLGIVEWKDSLPTCQRLADTTGLELAVVRRKAGGMFERWVSRWQSSVERYVNLNCVKLILPWSTPAMRFCTAELKRDVICSYLRQRFIGKTILSVSGIRRDESTRRMKAPTLRPQPKMRVPTKGTYGYDWNPLLSWSEEDVYSYLREKNFRLHEAYTKYGMSRVSCAFCIMSSASDMRAATTCADNVPLYRQMVDLEIESTFAFQSNKWLGDVAPSLLSHAQLDGLDVAKQNAKLREELEEEIPSHLLYTKGWPTCLPTKDEADLIAGIRTEVSEMLGLPSKYLTGDTVLARYEELMSLKNEETPSLASTAARG